MTDLLVDDPDFRLYVGDAREALRELEDGSVDCIVTSPPYYALRDYGVDGQIGLEDSVHEYVEALVAVFREARRVLADHGTVWLNIGDSYAAGVNGMRDSERWPKQSRNADGFRSGRSKKKPGDGIKQKDMIGVPWRLAFALQADGWYLRSDVIWSKSNAMPESVTDRPAKSHEYVFMLTKQRSYWYDRVAVLEPFAEASLSRYAYGFNKVGHGVGEDGASHTKGEGSPVFLGAKVVADPAQPTLDESLPPEAPRGPDGRRATKVVGGENSEQHRNGERWPNEGRNLRTVWTIPTQPLADKHFAVFPEALVEKCLMASCPLEVCATCGEPRYRIVDRVGGPQGDHVAAASGDGDGADNAVRETGRSFRAAGAALSDRYREHGYASFETSGWTDCGHDAYRPGVVLDPFLGSGTTALVARRLGRRCVGVELNERYARIALKRTQQLSLLA